MLLNFILTIITFRTLPGLNKILNETISANYGTTIIETKMSYVIYTRIAAVVLLLTGIVSGQVLVLSCLGEGISIYNGLFQITQVSLFIEIFIVIIGALILVAWPGLPVSVAKVAANLGSNTSSLPFTQPSFTYEASSTKLNTATQTTEHAFEKAAEPLYPNKAGINLTNYYQNYLDKSKDYVLIILFNLFGALLLISSFDFVSLYLSIELQSFALYILATFYKESRIVTAAGLKYFLLGALSSCFILLGAALIYAFSGLTKFDSIYCLITTFDPFVNHTQFTLGFVLIFIGFLFKIGAAPLHNWAPDVYNDTPTIVTIWLTIMPKLSILILLLELYLQIDTLENNNFFFNLFMDLYLNISILLDFFLDFFKFIGGADWYVENKIINSYYIPAYVDQGVQFWMSKSDVYFRHVWTDTVITPWGEATMSDLYALGTNWIENLGGGSSALYNLLFVSSLLSLIIGTVLGLAQSQIKRLMAYSTIAHLGFILLALSINTEEALDSFLFYIIQYTITNLNVFLIIIAFNYLLCSLVKNNLVIKDIKYISELTNQYNKNPILTVSFIICLLSMAGIPPFIGFYSKLFVLFSAISISEYFLAIIAIIVSVISAYYYLRIIKVLYTEDNNKSTSGNTTTTTTTTAEASKVQVTATQHSSSTVAAVRSAAPLILTNIHSLVIAVLSLFLVLFFLNPVLILTSTRVLSLSLFNF